MSESPLVREKESGRRVWLGANQSHVNYLYPIQFHFDSRKYTMSRTPSLEYSLEPSRSSHQGVCNIPSHSIPVGLIQKEGYLPLTGNAVTTSDSSEPGASLCLKPVIWVDLDWMVGCRHDPGR